MTGSRTAFSRRDILVLAAAALPPIHAAGATDGAIALQPIADGVFVFSAPYELAGPGNGGAIANMSVVVGGESAAVIDTGNSLGAGTRMLAAVRQVTGKPVRYVVNSHMHPDHVLGNAAFADEGARFVAHTKLPRALAQRAGFYLDRAREQLGDAAFAGTRIVLPDLLVDSQLSLDLGARSLLLEAHPTAHTDNDLTVLDRETGTWFLGDLLFMGHVPTLDGSLLGWLRLLDALQLRWPARVVPGHGPASAAWPDAAGPERRYLERLRSDMRQLIAEGRSMVQAAEDAGRSQEADWALFAEFNSRNAIAAYHEMEWE